MNGYMAATRHPWSNLLFVTPLLIAYEVGVLLLSRDNPDALRNGADIWVREALAQYGLPVLWAAPAAIFLFLFLIGVWYYSTRPDDSLGTFFGMAIESVVFAVAIWALSKNFRNVFEQTEKLVNSVSTPQQIPYAQIVNFLGAGIYEEFLFRFLLYSLMYILFRIALLPGFVSTILAALLSSLVFSAAHHIGPMGEEMIPMVFFFRTVVGLVFTAVFAMRGLGIVIGAHAGYNILVGTSLG